MGKKNIKQQPVYAAAQRSALYNYYHNMFYNLWMGKYTVDGMNYRQNDFFFRKLWSEGYLAIFRKKYLEDEDAVGLATYSAVGEYDGLDMPVEVQLVQNRGDMTIPIIPQKVDKDCVIGWAQLSRRPIAETMDMYASKLSGIDMLINVNEKVQKMPWLINTPEGSEKKTEEFMNALMGDEPVLFFELDGLEPRALISGAPFILDKLYNYKQAYVNEALTFLGVNNLGNVEKKERLITSEVDHNNELIESNSDNFKRPIEEFLDRANDVLGFNFTLKDNSPKPKEQEPEDGFEPFGSEGKEETSEEE